jgi:hypothetical protein
MEEDLFDFASFSLQERRTEPKNKTKIEARMNSIFLQTYIKIP